MIRLPIVTALAAAFSVGASGEAVSAPPTPAPIAVTGPMSGPQIAKALDRASVLGSVLYVAAHPDDENTHLLAWFVGERNLRAAYVSLTRGGGGQNLIGAEQSELLGLIRTRELLEARRIDGAEQFFTRARDFGYSKTPEETLRIWDRDQALGDLVYVIRRVRPDVIVTRFPLKGKTHGHHVASAILAAEAFEAAADPKRFPEQLAHVDTWQATRVVENKPHWRIRPDTDTTGWLPHDVAGYDALVGHGWDEVAAASRSMHKSQGFGSAPRRGVVEYFVPVKGTPYKSDLLDGVDTSWARVAGGAAVGALIDRARAAFDPRHPDRILPLLVKARAAVDKVGDAHWRRVKAEALDQLIVAAAGVVIEAKADAATVAPGNRLSLTVEALARTPGDHKVMLESLAWPWQAATMPKKALHPRKPTTLKADVTVPLDHDPTVPHWLAERPTPGAYVIKDPRRIGDPDDPAAIRVLATLRIAGRTVEVSLPVEHVWVDPVMGQRRRDAQVTPPVTTTFGQSVVMVPTDRRGTSQAIELVIDGWAQDARATVHIDAPNGVTVSPNTHSVTLKNAGDQARIKLAVSAKRGAAPGELVVRLDAPTGKVAWQATTIDYPHIPRRTVLSPARLKVVPVDLKLGGSRIAYVPGSGDRVAASLASVGYDVDELPVAELLASTPKALSTYDAVIIGVRAYNVHSELFLAHDLLMDYVRAGGRVITQYQTNTRWRKLVGPMGPASFTISRGRVTDETATMRALDRKHPALRSPNALTDADWQGWVQERGLYFASTWDKRYTPILSANDPGEKPLTGSTLIAHEGKGVFIYTGLSFFRQLPAGVAGAYRLLANLLALDGRK